MGLKPNLFISFASCSQKPKEWDFKENGEALNYRPCKGTCNRGTCPMPSPRPAVRSHSQSFICNDLLAEQKKGSGSTSHLMPWKAIPPKPSVYDSHPESSPISTYVGSNIVSPHTHILNTKAMFRWAWTCTMWHHMQPFLVLLPWSMAGGGVTPGDPGVKKTPCLKKAGWVVHMMAAHATQNQSQSLACHAPEHTQHGHSLGTRCATDSYPRGNKWPRSSGCGLRVKT